MTKGGVMRVEPSIRVSWNDFDRSVLVGDFFDCGLAWSLLGVFWSIPGDPLGQIASMSSDNGGEGGFGAVSGGSRG